MGQMTIEPSSDRAASASLHVSLRGSLADQYYRLVQRGNTEAQTFIERLLISEDPNVLCFPEEEVIVIGLKSEMECYLPGC